eukprot:gene612-biopygen7645
MFREPRFLGTGPNAVARPILRASAKDRRATTWTKKRDEKDKTKKELAKVPANCSGIATHLTVNSAGPAPPRRNILQ